MVGPQSSETYCGVRAEGKLSPVNEVNFFLPWEIRGQGDCCRLDSEDRASMEKLGLGQPPERGRCSGYMVGCWGCWDDPLRCSLE
jgi:hypothetical protein